MGHLFDVEPLQFNFFDVVEDLIHLVVSGESQLSGSRVRLGLVIVGNVLILSRFDSIKDPPDGLRHELLLCLVQGE